MSRWWNRPKKHSTRDLWRKGDKLIKKGHIDKAEELLLAAAESPSPLDRHYAYVRLIRLYSKLECEGVRDVERLIEFCKKDIDLFPEFYEAWMVEYMNNVPTPYFPSFSVLADIYEQRGMLAEAVSVCELALGYGLTETAGEDFPSRLERLLAGRDS
jgi:tetratricopeptide (TPR) repeat protein